jgi:hypothetical protein
MLSLFILAVVQVLILVFILVLLVWTKNWQILLGLAILTAGTGFFAVTLYIETDLRLLPGSQIDNNVLVMVVIALLKAIFLLLLAIFAWLQKNSAKL